ncbi:MAG: hypothetical protein ACRDN0_13565, partial [Trebonia sp.]
PRPPLPVNGRKPKRTRPHAEVPVEAAPASSLVEFDCDALIRGCVKALDDHLNVDPLRYFLQQGESLVPGLAEGPGFTATLTTAPGPVAPAWSQVQYDLLGEISAKTQLTRRTVASILRQITPATFAMYRQNPDQFITESARLISAQLAELIPHPQIAPATSPRHLSRGLQHLTYPGGDADGWDADTGTKPAKPGGPRRRGETVDRWEYRGTRNDPLSVGAGCWGGWISARASGRRR